MTFLSTVRQQRFTVVATASLLVTGLALSISAPVLSSTPPTEYTASPRLTTTSEDVVRKRVLELARPACPDAAVPADAARVGVVEVQIVRSGRVIHARALEPQSGPIVIAIEQAAMQSTFLPLLLVNDRPEVLSTKLTFYFHRVGGRCQVSHPAEVGYVPIAPADDPAGSQPRAAGSSLRRSVR